MSEPHRLPDPAEPQPTALTDATTGLRPPSMRDQWADLISSTHSPRRWTVIAAAIATADAATVDPFGAPMHRGDEAWCRVAITALESPTAATAAQQLPDVLPSRCFADADLLRAWLTAPAAYAERGRTVVAGLDLVDWLTASDAAIHRAVVNLVEQAQHAGVYGVDGFRIEVHRLVDTDDWHAGYLLVARPPFGPALASDELVDADLLPSDEPSKLEGAVRVLTDTARVVNAMLDSHAANGAPARPVPAPIRGQAFLAGADATTQPTPPAPNPSAPGRSTHTR